MKYFFICSLLAIFAFTNCTNDSLIVSEPIDEPLAQSITQTPKIYSVDEAAEIAEDGIKTFYGGNSRTLNSKTFNRNNSIVITNSKSRSGNDTLMYIFNFDNEEGFAIVAADKSYKPALIAITESGNYTVDSSNNFPGLNDYMEKASTMLSNRKPIIDLDSINTDDLAEYRIIRDTTYYHEVKPNFELCWGQEIPEGDLCPNGFCGCLNLAVGMALTYTQMPISKIPLTYDNISDSLSINWKELRQHKRSYSHTERYKLDNDECVQNTHETIAKMLRQFGHTTNSTYYFAQSQLGTGTGTNPKNLNQLLSFVNLTAKETLYYAGQMYNAVSNTSPLIIIGLVSNIDACHAWLIDGVYGIDYHEGEYVRQNGGPWILANDRGDTSIRYLHMNWGWNGFANGYFNLGVYDSEYASIIDNKSLDGTHYTFQYVYAVPVYKKANTNPSDFNL